MKKQAQIEKRALLIGSMIYLIMGSFGWYTHYISKSEAMLLEGNYNMVNALASLIGYYVVQIRHRKTETFPLGQFVYESLYALIKGILILGILTAALWENSVKIYDYFKYSVVHQVNKDPIVYMVILSVLLSFFLAYFYHYSNKQTGNSSTMLATDKKAALIDGYLSIFGGGSLLLMIYIGQNFNGLEFLQYIGDALVVLIFEIIMIREPFKIIKENFVELAGGQLQSDKDCEFISHVVKKDPMNGFNIINNYITKVGSMYVVTIFINPIDNCVSMQEISVYRRRLMKILGARYNNLTIEIVLNN
ncbi:MAG: cation transporter [Sphingobacterium sp.]